MSCLDYRLQRENYWMKTLRTACPYELNERKKFMNKDSPFGKLFPPLPRYSECFTNTRTQSKINNIDFSVYIEILFNFYNNFF